MNYKVVAKELYEVLLSLVGDDDSEHIKQLTGFDNDRNPVYTEYEGSMDLFVLACDVNKAIDLLKKYKKEVSK